MGRVTAVCISSVRQEPKRRVGSIRLVRGGVEGDSHLGVTEREVSLLRAEDIRKAELEAGFPFPAGSLAENLIIEGLPVDMAPGTRIALGESAVLEVVEKGKKPGEPHSYDYRGWCLLPTVGFFLRVIEEGRVYAGDEAYLV